MTGRTHNETHRDLSDLLALQTRREREAREAGDGALAAVYERLVAATVRALDSLEVAEAARMIGAVAWPGADGMTGGMTGGGGR